MNAAFDSPWRVPGPMNTLTLPLGRYRIEAITETPLSLPFYAGSMLRGAFGHALRDVACLTRHASCTGCPHTVECAYARVFEPTLLPGNARHDTPTPCVVEPPQPGERRLATGEPLSFDFVLFGPALEELPRVLLAWQRALRHGLGAGRARCRPAQVCWLDPVSGQAFDVLDGQGCLLPHDARVRFDRVSSRKGQAVLDFQTPLRLQRRGEQLVPEQLRARDVLETLVRRLQSVATACGVDPGLGNTRDLGELADAVALSHDLRWMDWDRYSTRQQRGMPLGGMVGTCALRGDLTPFTLALEAGQWLHIGKNAVFGLGQYRLH